MTARTLLSSFLLTGLVVMAPAFAQEPPPETITPDPVTDPVAGELITDISVAGQGEVEIGNTLANALVDTGASPDFDTALTAVQDLRAEGMGWGQVAHELGFNLGHEVSAVRSDGRAAAARATDTLEPVDAGDVVLTAHGDLAPVTADSRGRTGADTAASARLQSQVGRGIAADARANARVNVGVRADVGRPLGVGAPVRPDRPLRLDRPERPVRGGR